MPHLPLLICLLALLVGHVPRAMAQAPATDAWVQSPGKNRPGADIAQFQLPVADPKACRQACSEHPFCVSYTYVKPGHQGPEAQCWLKNDAPALKADACCDSGRRAGAAEWPGTVETGIDLPGRDLRESTLPGDDPLLCAQACQRDDDCNAWTYVRPGVRGPQAQCWLKEAAPGRRTDDCCTSGVRDRSLTVMDRMPAIDLNGNDIDDFALPRGGPSACAAACDGNPDCAAWTYVRSTLQRPVGHCWLKDAVPAARESACCDSGAKRPAANATTMPKGGTDLPGGDYRHFKVGRARADVCRAACGADDRCLAYTFVRPGVQGPDAMCWLKDRVPAQAKANACCASGRKLGSHTGKPVDPESHRPRHLEFSEASPRHAVAGVPMPADMPPVRMPDRYQNCNRGQIDAIQRAWARGHHDLWRAHQLMQHVDHWSDHRRSLWSHGFVDRRDDPNFGYANWSPRGWFGPYDGKRFAMARRAIAKTWNERFRGRTFHAACRIDENRQGPHPCHVKKSDDPSANHIVFGKINFCDAFFDGNDNAAEESRARLVVHEIMHWLKIPKSIYWVSDNHDHWKRCLDYEAIRPMYGDLAAYIGLEGGCRDWNHNRAVRNNDSYAHFANQVGRRVRSGQLIKFPAEDFDWSR
jgi:PAN domain